MMATSFQKVNKALLVLALLAFLSLGFFGMSQSSMAMGQDGSMTMSNCPYLSGEAAVCNMNPLDHIALWQSMFATTLQQHGSSLLMLLLTALALALVFATVLHQRLQTPQLAFSVIARREKYLPPPLLQELFSSGILNPKFF